MKKWEKKPIILFFVVLALAFYVFNFSLSARVVLAGETTIGSEEEIDDTEGDIKKIEKKLKEEESKKERYEQDLNRTQSAINSTQSAINKTEVAISETENTIERKEKELESLSKKMLAQKEVLTRLIQELYYIKKNPIENYFTSQENFSKIIGNMDSIITLEEKINVIISNIKGTKDVIENDKKELEEEKESHENLLVLKENQKQVLNSEKNETQTKVAKKEASISKLNSELSKLKSSLSKLLGKSYDFDDILKAAKFAGKATGVRKDYLLGMLVVESNLGRYTGGCNYKESRMSSYRKKIFKEICKGLDYNYKKKKVSCPPASYKGTGGAMGVAQFIA